MKSLSDPSERKTRGQRQVETNSPETMKQALWSHPKLAGLTPSRKQWFCFLRQIGVSYQNFWITKHPYRFTSRTLSVFPSLTGTSDTSGHSNSCRNLPRTATEFFASS